MKYTYKFNSYCISLLLVVTQCSATPVFGIFSWFNSMPNEQKMKSEYPIKVPGMLVIDNLDGDVTITTSNVPKVIVSAVKKASNEDDLDEIIVDAKQVNESHVSFITKYDQKEIKGGVDYTFSVPANMNVKVCTRDGAITIKGVTGTIEATTKNGDIDIVAPKKHVEARTKKTGSITIQQPANKVTAHTVKGSISIYDAEQSVKAETDQGHIEASFKKVNNNSRIFVKSEVGDLILYLPEDTNAELKAKTEKGGIRCDHDIAIKPFTTQLNNKTWNKLKKEVHGTLGSGEASVVAHSKYGSIKIFKGE